MSAKAGNLSTARVLTHLRGRCTWSVGGNKMDTAMLIFFEDARWVCVHTSPEPQSQHPLLELRMVKSRTCSVVFVQRAAVESLRAGACVLSLACLWDPCARCLFALVARCGYAPGIDLYSGHWKPLCCLKWFTEHSGQKQSILPGAYKWLPYLQNHSCLNLSRRTVLQVAMDPTWSNFKLHFTGYNPDILGLE